MPEASRQPPAICGVSDDVAHVSITSGSAAKPFGCPRWSSVYPSGTSVDGSTGNVEHETPRIDRLAREGVLFLRAFCTNGLCSPTRASILTGLMPSQHGVHIAMPDDDVFPKPDGYDPKRYELFLRYIRTRSLRPFAIYLFVLAPIAALIIELR